MAPADARPGANDQPEEPASVAADIGSAADADPVESVDEDFLTSETFDHSGPGGTDRGRDDGPANATGRDEGFLRDPAGSEVGAEGDRASSDLESVASTGDRPGEPRWEHSDDGGAYEAYVKDAASLFGETGEFADFWNAEAGTFDEEAWADASLERRQALVGRLEEARADALGQMPCEVELIAMPAKRFGDYDPDDNSIDVNANLGCEDTVVTVAHEGFHAYQESVMSDPLSEDPRRQAWLENDTDYITYEDDPIGYRLQAIESDAFKFEDDFMDSLADRLGEEE